MLKLNKCSLAVIKFIVHTVLLDLRKAVKAY